MTSIALEKIHVISNVHNIPNIM